MLYIFSFHNLNGAFNTLLLVAPTQQPLGYPKGCNNIYLFILIPDFNSACVD
jgi:hypothetical protein